MQTFMIYYQPPMARATETRRYATTAKAARDDFERQHPDCEVLCVYPERTDPRFSSDLHHSADYWEASTETA